MNLNVAEYRDKVLACFIGKNIGGTMGEPYEGKRMILDVKGFSTPPSVALPNDDLDLQLVWLWAVRQYGPHQLNATTLGEFWLDFVVAHWNEYGIGKANMRRGMYPSLSGDFGNHWKHSNGAWIRTEIWATLAPASPDVAAKYAIEDAIVDHGTGEGTIAAAFVAAMQSAAFVCSDIDKLIDIGLSKIPAESRMAKSIKLAIDCYQKGMPATDARNLIQESNADIGTGWFEAPSNVAYAVLGLLYGEGDFKKSMLTAINCGDDTDCTAATVGATLGIMYGTAGIPTDWREHVGDTIVTKSINRCLLAKFPKTCTQLTDMIAEQAPAMLLANAKRKRYQCALSGEPTDLPEDILAQFTACTDTLDRLASIEPYSFEVSFCEGALSATVIYEEEPILKPNSELKLRIRFTNNWTVFGNARYNFNLRWITPDGITVTGLKGVQMVHTGQHNPNHMDVAYVIHTKDHVEAENRIVLEIGIKDHFSTGYVPMVIPG